MDTREELKEHTTTRLLDVRESLAQLRAQRDQINASIRGLVGAEELLSRVLAVIDRAERRGNGDSAEPEPEPEC